MIKKICKAVAFLLVFALLFSGLQTLLRGKWLGKNITATLDAYEKAQTGSIDVLFVGSSHAFASINPLQLWEESGTTSFVLGNAWQQVPATAYLLERALKTQTPQLVCFEVRSTAYDSHMDEDKIHQLVDDQPFSMEKYRGIESMKWESDSMLYLLSPLLRFHTRWKDLNRQDYDYLLGRQTGGYNAKGFLTAYQKTEVNLDDYNDPVENAAICAENLAAMDAMVALCESKDIQMLFWKSPTEEWRKAYADSVQAYADAHEIPFLDTTLLTEEISLSLTEDFNDISHLNVWGAKKFTTYMNDYLQQHYTLPDRRGDTEIAAAWNRDAAAYERTTIAECDDIAEYFLRLRDENTTAVLALTATYGAQVSPEAQAIFSECGLNGMGNLGGNAYMAVLNGGAVQFYGETSDPLRETVTVRGVPFSADVAAGAKTNTTLRVGTEDVTVTQTGGLSIVVYDHEIGAVVDTVTFDIYGADCKAAHVRIST